MEGKSSDRPFHIQRSWSNQKKPHEVVKKKLKDIKSQRNRNTEWKRSKLEYQFLVKITEKAPIFELVGHQIENLNQTRNSKPLKLSLPQSSRQIYFFFPISLWPHKQTKGLFKFLLLLLLEPCNEMKCLVIFHSFSVCLVA
jgi:hypothetical protein